MYVTDNKETLDELFRLFKAIAWVDCGKLKSNFNENITSAVTINVGLRHKELIPEEIRIGLQELKQWMQHKRYSDYTIQTYLYGVKSYLMFINPKPLHDVDNNDMVRYVNEYIIKTISVLLIKIR